MRKLLLLTSFAILAILSNPARAQFCPGAAPWVFDDVPVSDQFCGFITWAAEHGITLGCAIIDANHRLYCPNDSVTRGQMAAFVNRLGNVRVEAVGTGPGLLGGPITSTGTISLAATQLLPTTSCANNQIPRWNGSAWTCSSDANSGGTVTSVGSGTGLTGGPVTATGTLSIAPGYQLPQGCANGQVAKSNGSNAWTCASDATGTGTVTNVASGTGLLGGPITTTGTLSADTAYLQRRVSTACAVGSSIRAIAADGSVTCQTDGPTNAFVQNGNAFGATAMLGTTDNQAIDVIANGSRVMRYEPSAISPNVIGGSPANNVTAGVRGATIGGGGVPPGDSDPNINNEAPNRVTDVYGTVGGGFANRAGDDAGTTLDRPFATVGGGYVNTASGQSSTVGGGSYNTASGSLSTVAGGLGNTASGSSSTVPGGQGNVASGVASFAAGTQANADADGCFVWNDRSSGSISCGGAGVGANRVVMRATGGFIFITNSGNTNGAELLPGANAWSIYSDRNYKDHMREVDARAILDQLIDLPITTWNWKSQDAQVRHMGPTAQDFHSAFGLGETPRMINTVDVSGVALAAIKGLNAKLEAEVAEQAREIAELRRAVEVLMARTAPDTRVAAK